MKSFALCIFALVAMAFSVHYVDAGCGLLGRFKDRRAARMATSSGSSCSDSGCAPSMMYPAGCPGGVCAVPPGQIALVSQSPPATKADVEKILAGQAAINARLDKLEKK